MSTIAEIEAALSQLPPAQFVEVRRWMNAYRPPTAPDETRPQASKTPDFLGRQKELFGDRVLPDSQAIFDEMRADRF
jgi:hypothetical protein